MSLVETFFNYDVFSRTLPLLLTGLVTTIELGVVAIIFGSVLGLIICLTRLYAAKPLRYAAIIYIDVMRALPTLVVLIVIYYALPFVGVRLSAFVSASIALCLVLAAYTAEVFRSGIEAVPKGQFEAAQALGLRFRTTLRLVVVPQALRIVIPPTTSNFIAVIKDTSLASIVAMPDLLKQAMDAQAYNANPTPLLGAALIYLVVLWPMVRFVGFLERRAQTDRKAG